jgi:endonuclease I
MFRIILLIQINLLFVGLGLAQIPSGYYNGTSGLNGSALKSKLHKIIRGHTERTYSQLWTDFEKTDVKSNGKVWDMYSDVPGGTPSYEFTFGTNQCGTYSAEGDCYNREHSFPKSWWGGGTSSSDTMYTDLFHLVPTDGYVNNQRSSYPYGEVGTATWTSSNGSKLGTSNYGGYTGTVFEPIDAFKGDFARSYFYMATRYLSRFDSWASNTDMLDGSGFSTWALDLLLDWHHQDPVSQKEINRNDSIYTIQGNRNPFIDHPEWVDSIWNPSSSSGSGSGSGSGSSSSSTYAEGFDTGSNWAGGTMTGYNAKTYTLPSPSYNDHFSTNSAVRETSNTHSSGYAWRVDDNANHYLRYECEGTVSSFSIWAARWDNSPKPNVTVRYSLDGGSSYTTAFTFTGDDFSGDKIYKQFSHTFASPITNNSGSKIYIEFLTTSGERMLYDDFEITFSSSSNSNESDIIKNTSWSEPQNIDYTNYITASGLTTTNSIEVGKFTIRDGGSDNTDADGVSTILTDIQFGIDNYENIDAIALFDGSTNIAEITNITSNLSFSGLNIEATDEGTKDFSVYVSFKSSVTDNQNINFTISSVSADAGGSGFATSDGGGASTDNTGSNNKIVVTADRLIFSTNKPPSSVNTNTNFDVEVSATDVNDNIDLDISSSVTLSLSSGTGVLSSTAGLTQNLSSGTYLWTDIQYDTEEDFRISASSSGLASATSILITASSNNYFSDLMITEYVEGSSNNKYIEIWNNTGASVDLSDYSIEIYYNGSTSVGKSISLSGTLAQNGIYIIANSSATAWSGTPDLSTGNLNFNGNDAVVLVNSNVKGNVDVVGTIGSSSDFAKDKTLERNATAAGPNSTYTTSEWDTKAKDDVSGLGNPGPLPVELLSFNAVYKNEQIILEWETASETNNDFFTIERSEDAKYFSPIGVLKGAGNSTLVHNYQFIDKNIKKGIWLYYRLKQTDFSGNFTYSKTISIQPYFETTQLTNYYYSNRVLYLEIQGSDVQNIIFRLYNLNGQLLISNNLKVYKGNNRYQIKLPNHVSGLYFMQLTSDRINIAQKVMVY